MAGNDSDLDIQKSVRLSRKDLEAIQRKAEEEDRDESNLIRHAIRSYIYDRMIPRSVHDALIKEMSGIRHSVSAPPSVPDSTAFELEQGRTWSSPQLKVWLAQQTSSKPWKPDALNERLAASWEPDPHFPPMDEYTKDPVRNVAIWRAGGRDRYLTALDAINYDWSLGWGWGSPAYVLGTWDPRHTEEENRQRVTDQRLQESASAKSPGQSVKV